MAMQGALEDIPCEHLSAYGLDLHLGLGVQAVGARGV